MNFFREFTENSRIVHESQGTVVLKNHANNAYKDFAEWLTRQMDQRGISQQQLSTKMGCSPSTISQLVNRHRSPSEITINRLARCFKIKIADIPCVTEVENEELAAEQVFVIDHEIPDHSLFASDTIQGIFLEEDIGLENYRSTYQSLSYPDNCYDCIETAIYRSRSALVCGAKSFFGERAGVVPYEFNTHKYKGFSMICRSSMRIDTVFSCLNEDLPRLFRSMLEVLTDANMWPGDVSQNRVGCLGLEEVRFIRAIEGMKNELFDGIAFEVSELKKCIFEPMNSGKILDRLEFPGSRGYDIIVGDAMCLSRGIADPAYKVIMTLGDIRRLINYVSATRYTVWANTLKNTYGTETTNEAIDIFYNKWSGITSALEMPVFWFLYIPSDWDDIRKAKLSRRIGRAIERVKDEIKINSSRNRILNEVHSHISCTHDVSCDIDSFLHAWNSSYVGL